MNQHKGDNGSKTPISDVIISRLSRYHSTLCLLEREHVWTVSSQQLAEMEGLSPAQVRKDLSVFGSFGQRGVGYDVQTLRENIGRILGLNREWNIAVIGVGQFGNVLINSEIFREKNLHIKKIFDTAPEMIGKKLKDIEISDIADLEKKLTPEEIDLAIIALPPVQVQSVIGRLSRIGIKGVLYFASRSVKTEGHMAVRKRDISVDLGALTYDISKNEHRETLTD